MKTTHTHTMKVNRWLLLYARCSVASVAAGVPTLTSLWHSRGMSRSDFYLLEIIFALSLLVLEIATGRFADRFGKVLTLRLGFVALTAGAALYAVAPSFGGFVLGELLLALGLALISGTDEAFLFQSNQALGETKAHQLWWTWSIALSFMSMALYAVVGAQLGETNPSVPFWFCTGCQVTGLVASLFMHEPPLQAATQSGPKRSVIGEAISSVLLSSTAVRWMVLAPGFISGVNQTFLWVYSEFLGDCDIHLGESGYVFALFHLVAGMSALGFRKIKHTEIGVRIYFALLVGLLGSTIGLISMVGGLAWLFILPQQVVRSVSGALFSQTINEAIPDHVRATALSVRNALRVLLCVAAMVPWWLAIDEVGRQQMFVINLVMLAVGGTIFWITSPRSTEEKV